MPDFLIRAWAEKALRDFHDYRVTAETLPDAVKKLDQMQTAVQRAGVGHPLQPEDGIQLLNLPDADWNNSVALLEPDTIEVYTQNSGYTLLDDNGNEIAAVPPPDLLEDSDFESMADSMAEFSEVNCIIRF